MLQVICVDVLADLWRCTATGFAGFRRHHGLSGQSPVHLHLGVLREVVLRTAAIVQADVSAEHAIGSSYPAFVRLDVVQIGAFAEPRL